MTPAYIRRLCSISLVMLICAMGRSNALAIPTISAQRSDEKVIGRELYPDEPVEIGSLALKNVRIDLNQKFSVKSLAERSGGQEEDWLEGLEFTVRNKSDKRITYLVLSLHLPDPGNPDPSVGMFHHFTMGVDLRATGDAATYAEPFSLEAAGSHVVRLSDKDLKEIKKHLALWKKSLADVNRVFLRTTSVGFEDGRQWTLGKYTVPEKQRPDDRKAVEKATYEKEPYEITNLSVKKIQIPSREKLISNGYTNVRGISYEFSARSVAESGSGREEDWLEGLQLTIRNKSDKQITYIGVSIQFPETQVNGPGMRSNLADLGIHPQTPAEFVKRAPLVLEPGDTVTCTLSAEGLKGIKDFLALRKFQLAALNRAVIEVDSVVFEDGVRWALGRYFRPNPNAPNGYEDIDK